MFRRIHIIWLATLLVLVSATPAHAAPAWAGQPYTACATGAVTSHTLVNVGNSYLFRLDGWSKPCQPLPSTGAYFGVLTFDDAHGFGTPTVAYLAGDAPTAFTVDARPLTRWSSDWAMVRALCVSHGPSNMNLACFAVSLDATRAPSLSSIPVDDPRVLKPWYYNPTNGPDCGLCA
jgi:hypothetical protein